MDHPVTARTRPDRCPGVLRPWPAEDGGLVRLRIAGGRVPLASLTALLDVTEEYADGRVHLTTRANLQLRGLRTVTDQHGPALPDAVVTAIEATGLLPSRRHDVARNLMTSPQTGLAGGRADLRPVLAAVDAAILAEDGLAGLPGRFLITLDDGRGDLADRHRDLGLVALSTETAQLRVGRTWGPVLPLADTPAALVGLALLFLARRGSGPAAPWHVDELASYLIEGRSPEPGATVRSGPLPYGRVPGGEHVAATFLDRAEVERWTDRTDTVVVTPWRGVLVPEGAA